MKKQILIATAALLAGLAACTPTTPEQEKEPSTLTLSPVEIVFEAGAGQATINIESNTKWCISDIDEAWVSAEPSQGDGNGTVTVTCPANTDYDSRLACITFTTLDGAVSNGVSIMQNEAKGLLVEQTVYEVGAEGGQITITLQTNAEITCKTDAEWITEASTRTLSEKELTFDIAANEAYEPRTGIITIEGDGLSEEITVVQGESGIIAVSKEVEPVAAEGGTFSIDVRTNIDFEVSIQEGASWLTVAETRAVVDTVVNFSVAANDTVEERSAEIYFTSELGTDTVSVSQIGNRNVNVTFSNDDFKAYLVKRFDSDKDGELTHIELDEVKELTLWQRNNQSNGLIYKPATIYSFEDLALLPNLEYLDMQSMDKRVTKIDVTANTKLRVLNVANCKITSLDVTTLTELEELNISGTGITTIDLSNNSKIKKLHVGGSRLTSLDIAHMSELTLLNCAYAKLQQLNVSANTKLEAIYCNGNALTELDLSALTALKRLNCDHNRLTALDLTANTALEYLNCGRNQLTSLNISGLANLKNVACSNNLKLRELSLDGLTSLNFLHAAYTTLTTLDASPAPNLWMINANNSKLTSINIEQNSALRGLRVNNNVLTELDITKGDLRYLFADLNSTLTSIKVPESFNPATAVTFFKDATASWDGGQRNEYIDLSAKGTANCYIVNEAGKSYKFKATVKGNGYDPITGAQAEAIAPAKAYILWGLKKTTALGSDNTQLNTSILRQSVEVDKDGYICFTTPEKMEDGNFVIVAADKSDNILWSWHMWCVQGYDYEKTAVNVTVHGDNYYIMDRNLGAYANPAAKAAPTEEDYHYARGLFYQWGRKDPFVCGNSHIPDASYGYMSWIDWCEANGTLLKSPTFSIAGNNAYKYNAYIAGHNLSELGEILAHSIKNPMQFYKCDANWATTESNSNGQTSDWGKLWGNQKADGNGVKTMYDPCPVGYTVASPNRLKFITATGENTPVGATWQLNSTVEDISNADPNPLSSAPWGLEFYTKGLRTESGAPADKTTVFLPKQIWVRQNASIMDNNFICAYTNAPSAEAAWGGQPYKLLVTYTGHASSGMASWTNAAEAGSAFPVRCVSEAK